MLLYNYGMIWRKVLQIIFLTLVLLIATGCQTTEPSENSPLPSATMTTAVSTQPTTAPSTDTPLPPPPTSPPPSTATAVPLQPTATVEEATAVPPTATPINIPGLITAPFAENVNPLTGEVVDDPAVLQQRPIAIKITNGPANVRPQAGIGRADLLFEHLTEGGITRFTAVFHSKIPLLAGPIRSARLIDFEIPRMYDAAFGFSGSVGLIKLRFEESDLFNQVISPDYGHGGYFRMENPDVQPWNTMFTNPPTLLEMLTDRGDNRPPQFANSMSFHPEVINARSPARNFEIYYPATSAAWFFSNGRYLRWSDGEAHLDASTNTQLSFRNVVIIAANHVDTDIIEDTNGSPSIEIQIWGEGPASVFRDGVRIDGRWHRTDPSHMLTFTDLEGNPLALGPGNTFFHLVPLGFDRLYVTE